MKKITFFTNNMYTRGGTEKVLSLIANELSNQYEVEIISLFKTEDKPNFNFSNKIKVLNIYEQAGIDIVKQYFKVKLHLKTVLRNYQTDNFVVVGMRYFSLVDFMGKKTKLVAWEHYNSYISKIGSLAWFGRIDAKFKADKIIVLTEKDRKNNIKMFKTNPEKIVQIYNPIEYRKTEKEYDIHSKCIVSSGRFNHQKGYDMLVEIAEKVLKKHSDWEWHIYGDGEEKEKIMKLIHEKNLERNVILKGFSKNMNEDYRKYAFFALTSRFEGFAMVNIEAHYAQLPIVAFNCNCGPDEIIQDDVNGFLIDCFDIEAFADKVNYLIEHPEERKKMSEHTNLDKEKLKMENIMKEWEKIIESEKS